MAKGYLMFNFMNLLELCLGAQLIRSCCRLCIEAYSAGLALNLDSNRFLSRGQLAESFGAEFVMD
jgi:hypothetical protein